MTALIMSRLYFLLITTTKHETSTQVKRLCCSYQATIVPHYSYQSTYIMYLHISAENNMAAWKRGDFPTGLVYLSSIIQSRIMGYGWVTVSL